MELRDKIVVVTGGASGIGKAMAERFSAEGARKVVVVDLDFEGAQEVAAKVGGVAMKADVSVEADIVSVIERTESEIGSIDLFCSNAGIFVLGSVDAPNEKWQKIWDINVMAHVYAARALIPRMAKRGGGYLLNTASAAGLLSQIGSASYSVTKHAAVGLAENIAITHGHQGIKVSVLCPQAVRSKMTAGVENGGVAGVDGMLEPEVVCDAVVAGLAEERFMILPHPEVKDYFKRKADDYDRWIKGMRRLQERFPEMMG